VAAPRTSRGGHLRREVAETLLGVAPGERMPTMRELADRFGASLGATQAVVARLEHEGAVTTTHRGRSGAVLRDRSVGALWSAAREEPFVLALPLPSTRRIHALATALKASLSAAGVEAYLQFIRGSQRRLAALRTNRCHAIVMSALAAGALAGAGEVTVLELAAGSYVREHRVLYRGAPGTAWGPPDRVGVDPDSHDFLRLSELEFPAEATRVLGSYMHLAELLRRGDIDALVWDADEQFVALGPDVADRPLAPGTLDAVGTANTVAAVVTRASDRAAALVVQAAMAGPELRRVQDEVLEGRRNAEY
jgi:hypothetical protein